MENETDKRIERLEDEVRALRLELNELKGTTSTPKEQAIQRIQKPSEKKEELENHLVKLNKATAAKKKPIQLSEPEKQENKPKKQLSMEEIILWLLPKIFMIILVLGVLWGLKVISEFGLLSNGLKIALAYLLSIALVVIGIVMDMKKRVSSQIFTIVLYGGAFIIGILTTAAGAILYDVLDLYFALLLALIYIAYGITICYVKKNEVLSIFVIFTSLLLPYLLEYMDFNGTVILLYVLLVYAAIQFIFIKHGQSIAMYVAYAFSLIAIQVISSLNDGTTLLYALSTIVLNAIFLVVWWRLNKPFGKWRTVDEGLLFSLSGLTVLMINFMTVEASIPMLILVILYGAMAYLAYKRTKSRIVDIAGTLSLLTIFNLLTIINALDQFEVVILPLSAFLGLMLSLKLNALLMKITYTFLFTVHVLFHLLFAEITPFWNIEHLNYLLIFIYLTVLFIYLKKHSKLMPIPFGNTSIHFVKDLFPIIVVGYFFSYVFKLDLSYFSNSGYTYVTAFVLAIVMLISLFVSEKIIGKGLRYVLVFVFLLSFLNFIPTHYVDGVDIWLNLAVRISYALIIIAILADIYMKGYLYKSWVSLLKIDIDGFLTVGILGMLVFLYALLGQFQFDGLLSYFTVVTGKTFLLFIIAATSLWMSTKQLLRKVKVMGYCVLSIAIIKLVFFDLDSLSLIIRAVLFMVIGGIGLFLSNRLLSKNTKEA